MAIELHHLHPGHDDDLSRLKARIAELEKENAELKEQYREMDVTHTVHIAKMNALIEELEESQRWRKCSEELPPPGDHILVVTTVNGMYIRPKVFQGRYNASLGVFFTPKYECGVEVSHWMPMPSAPKEGK